MMELMFFGLIAAKIVLEYCQMLAYIGISTGCMIGYN